jgi:hypothetical protein
VCIQELQEATSVHEDAEELLGIGPFPFLVLILVRIRVGLRRTVPSYVKEEEEKVEEVKIEQKRGRK